MGELAEMIQSLTILLFSFCLLYHTRSIGRLQKQMRLWIIATHNKSGEQYDTTKGQEDG